MSEFFYQIARSESDTLKKVCAAMDLTCEVYSNEVTDGTVTALIKYEGPLSENFWMRFGEFFRSECDVVEMLKLK